MSGEKFNSGMNRRSFLKMSGLLLAIPYLNACNPFSAKPAFQTRITGTNSKTGHLLRENKFPQPLRTEQLNTLIVGGGISGLSAARWLKRNNFNDFKLVELDTEIGGNSKGGKNAISEYPFAAHYLPIPNENFCELIDFLSDHKIITGFDDAGLPLYDEYYICFEPQERLFYRGIWQDGLPPKQGLNEEEKKELIRFLTYTESFKNKIGTDGLPAFTIPLELSSKDEEFMKLDSMTIAEYLKQENYTTVFLLWYVNYCCKDDFGSTIENTSAWAAFHYFSSRNGKAGNASNFDLLAWPEGNHFLTKKLMSEVQSHLYTQMLTYKVEKENGHWNCFVFDVQKNESIKYECQQVIMATPQFVNKRILAFDTGINWDSFGYYPWIVANISIRTKKELNGLQDLSWDNVSYNSKSLGYVNACHQTFDTDKEKTVITYYYNFSEHTPKEERLAIYTNDENYWQKFIIDDLKAVHPKIEELVEDIEVNVLGHGMISPTRHFRSNPSRAILEKGFENLYFAHSDMSGISIFEQAFYRGILAAKQVLNKTDERSS
ncbi:MAG: dependent oxidoreductase [Bacteroidetes bacterium]|nr:dependent oxidoreductase [Bacteroidota bacterium]